jgi:hypothetical protein
MNIEARRLAVAALVRLADSPDYRCRVDAGRALASFVEECLARPVLLNLVLDAEKTFVTLETAEALLRRKDVAGLVIVSAAAAAAAAAAENEVADWLHSAVDSVFSHFERDRDSAMLICPALVDDPRPG